jgi:hypothetical protein
MIALLVLVSSFAAILILLPVLGLLRNKSHENDPPPQVAGRVSIPAAQISRHRRLPNIWRGVWSHFSFWGASRQVTPTRKMLPMLFYFGMIGLAYLLVEIPLIQQFILYLGNPAYAVTLVLFSLLLSSGIGSRLSGRIPASRENNTWTVLALLVLLLLALPFLFPLLVDHTLGFPLAWRMLITSLVLAPAGLLMGFPFPIGIRQITAIDSSTGSPWIGWSWAINGAASVIAAVMASLLALSFGFRLVFWTGAAAYALALLAYLTAQRLTVTRSPRQ